MIVFGIHKFGWVDEVEDLGCVATQFFHIMYVPLFPLGSYFVFADDWDRGVRIAFSIKSLLVAYTRSAVFWTALVCTVLGIATSGVTCCCALPVWGVYGAMPFLLRRASEDRAVELRDTLMSRMDAR